MINEKQTKLIAILIFFFKYWQKPNIFFSIRYYSIFLILTEKINFNKG